MAETSLTGPSPESHAVELELLEPLAPAIEAGTPFRLRLRVTCPSGCGPGWTPVRLEIDGRPLESTTRPVMGGEGGEAMVAVEARAPREPGEHELRVLLPRVEGEGIVYEEAELSLSLPVRPHATSLAVWGVPSPVVTGASFRVRVGVRSSAGCALGGERVVVLDEAERPVGEGVLGDEPARGTSALYPAEVELTGPDTAGLASWSVRFAGPERSELPHTGASARFSFMVAPEPEHRVTVHAVESGTGRPLGKVDVRVGVHLGSTDGDGVAAIDLPGGTYEMVACRAGWVFSSRRIEVAEDVEIELEAVPAPDPAEEEEQVWM